MPCMMKRDGRALDHKALEAIRIQAVQRVEAGESPEDVIRVLGFARPVIYDWLAKFREGGLDALRAKAIPGRPPRLDGKQLRWLYQVVTTKSPLQYRFEFALWTRGMVRDLIRERFGVRLSDVSVGRLLRKLGLSPQKPRTEPGIGTDLAGRGFPEDPGAGEEGARNAVFFGRSRCALGFSFRNDLGTERPDTDNRSHRATIRNEHHIGHQPAWGYALYDSRGPNERGQVH